MTRGIRCVGWGCSGCTCKHSSQVEARARGLSSISRVPQDVCYNECEGTLERGYPATKNNSKRRKNLAIKRKEYYTDPSLLSIIPFYEEGNER